MKKNTWNDVVKKYYMDTFKINIENVEEQLRQMEGDMEEDSFVQFVNYLKETYKAPKKIKQT